MPDLPPIGSLWLHEDGERRFVTFVAIGVWCAVTPFDPRQHDSCEHFITAADWLAWQAKAVRIDREDA